MNYFVAFNFAFFPAKRFLRPRPPKSVAQSRQLRGIRDSASVMKNQLLLRKTLCRQTVQLYMIFEKATMPQNESDVNKGNK